MVRVKLKALRAFLLKKQKNAVLSKKIFLDELNRKASESLEVWLHHSGSGWNLRCVQIPVFRGNYKDMRVKSMDVNLFLCCLCADSSPL